MPDQQHELLSACFRRSSLTDNAKPARFISPETAQQRRASGSVGQPSVRSRRLPDELEHPPGVSERPKPRTASTGRLAPAWESVPNNGYPQLSLDLDVVP